jgi:cytosine/adenosine deaminase-related metal-dependent hydrolase
MRRITANVIFPVTSAPLKNAYLEIDNNGTISAIKHLPNNKEIAGLEYYSGILVPGFVNAHCHLELSHLKNKIEKQSGLSNFVSQVQKLRNAADSEILKHIDASLKFMWSRGVNGLGDIVNYYPATAEKQKYKLLIHNFIELFNESNKTDKEIITKGQNFAYAFLQNNFNSSPAPHSIYGTSKQLITNIINNFDNKKITSIHFFESKLETGFHESEIIDYLNVLTAFDKILLVHNIYLNKPFLYKLKKESDIFKKLFFVLNLNSNLYIKSKLPDINLFYSENLRICLGTDSLASNNSLSILDEMKTVIKHFPDIPFEKILHWATINGAKALGFDNELGSFERNKTPGVILISGFDFKKNTITYKSEVKRLV